MAQQRGFYSQAVPDGALVDRDRYLVEQSRGRRVIHVGCSDAPITADRISAGSLLHAAIFEVAEDLVGVDIDRQATELVRAAVGGRYVLADISQPSGREALRGHAADLIIASDVLEHVPNASEFLMGLRELSSMPDADCLILISTPNGLAPRLPVSAALLGIEPNHPDHRALYTPSTLCAALKTAGLRPLEWSFYMAPGEYRGARRLVDFALRTAARARHGVADGMVVAARALS